MDSPFNEDQCLTTIRHYLPTQATLKDFVHHNSLHFFQEKEFFNAIFTASKIFGYKVTFDIETYRKLYKQGRIRPGILDRIIAERVGKRNPDAFKTKLLKEECKQVYDPRVGKLRAHWKSDYFIDMDNAVHPVLFRILGSYLDQGIALWHFPFEDKGLIAAVSILENTVFSGFFRSKRVKQLLASDDLGIEKLLQIIVGKSELFQNYLFDQQLAHKGWSGMVCAVEENSDLIFYKKRVSFKDLVLLELLLEIDALDRKFGEDWQPISAYARETQEDYLAEVGLSGENELLMIWQEAFEWSYYDEVLAAVGVIAKNKRKRAGGIPDFQAVFCIDDRECSLRRHLEMTDDNCATFGAPGHFGVAFYFQPLGAKFFDKNCPVAVTPLHLIRETEVKQRRPKEVLHSERTHTTLSGFMSALALGWVAGYRMVADVISPRKRSDTTSSFAHMDVQGSLLIEASEFHPIEAGLRVGFSVEEMADIVESLLKGIGLIKHFADLVYLVGHGSSSANNPHHGAYDCGACNGRPGGVNARVFAFMANHPAVRTILRSRGISIPDSTQFVGAMHDTACDEVVFYDEQVISAENEPKLKEHRLVFEQALDLNALERSRRFASISTNKSMDQIRKEVKKRSVSYFQPRPELGHGTNALCFVGARERIKGLFLDRRAFLQSYDYRTDPEGEILRAVLEPLPGICGGINLEYFFSRMDNQKMGAGSKLPYNVAGLIGVTNGSDGDLRTGLPLQMIESHDPVRLLMIVEHRPEVVLQVVESLENVRDWFFNGWLQLVALSPDDGNTYRFFNGEFRLYEPLSKVIESANILDVIAKSRRMASTDIQDATKENIPAQIYSSENKDQ